jgi:amidohydrolase
LNIKKAIEENMEEIKNLREKLHDNAELSFKEFKTQEIILNFFKNLDIHTEVMAKTGVVAVFNKGDECIALRADMDALPVNGVSHVCGHDYHMAIVAGTALVLKKLGFDKCIKFIFQPGEEDEGGALPMIKEGVLENPKVKNMIGFHVWPNVKSGTIEVSSGASMASVDDFRITFKGKGGHAAMPFLCKNPLYPAVDFIQTVNFKSQMEVNPLEAYTIAFTSVQCGTAPNVIADNCEVLGTIRTFDNNLRNKIYENIKSAAYLCARKYGCTSEVNYSFQYPPLVSDEAFTKRFIDTTKALIGEENVITPEKTFAAEDFSFFAEKVPSVHFRLGIEGDNKGIHPLHSSEFNASEDTIFHGIHIITNFILSLYS